MRISGFMWTAACALGWLSLVPVQAQDYAAGSSPSGDTVLVSTLGDSSPDCQVGDGCESCGGCEKLLGLIAPSDSCFCFISPMTNPVYFEDPRTLTEARFIYLHHKVPLTAGGGDINLIACQLRAALTDRLSVIATKDGYATSTNALIDDGWADINAGLKYNLYADAEAQQLLSAGATFELPVGSQRTLQGNGDGLFHLFLTGGTAFGNGNHWVSGSGFLLPADTNAESQVWYFSTVASAIRICSSWPNAIGTTG